MNSYGYFIYDIYVYIYVMNSLLKIKKNSIFWIHHSELSSDIWGMIPLFELKLIFQK